MATVGSLVVRIGSDISGLDAGLASAQSKLRSFGQNLRNVGAGLTLGLSAPLAAVGTSAIKMAADVERSMNIVQSMTNADTATMSKMEKQAWDLGAATKFNAQEVAQAQVEMSKAGMDLLDIYDAMPGVVNLAAAADMDLARAGEVVVGSLNMWEMQATDATKVADIYAAGAAASAVSMDELNQAVKMSGAVLADYGIDLDDTVTQLALLANNGLKGSDAGTSLKTMWLRLRAPTATAAAELERYNIAVYDHLGNAYKDIDILAQLERAMQGMTDVQRAAFMQTVFGTDAMRAASLLIGEGVASYEAMNAKINESGSAARQAGAYMEGFWGAIELLRGNIDTLLGSQASPFLDTLTDIATRAANAVEKISTLPEKIQRFGAVALGAVVLAGPLLLLLGGMVTAAAGLFSMTGLAILGIVLLAAAVAANWETIQTDTQTAIDAMQPYWERFQGWIDAAQAGDWATVVQGIKDVGAELQKMLSGQFTAGARAITIKLDAAGIKLDVAALRERIATQVGKLSGSLSARLGANLGIKLEAIDFDLSAVTAKVTAELAKVKQGIQSALSAGGWLDTAAVQTQIRSKLDAMDFNFGPVTQRIIAELNKVKLGVLLALSAGGGALVDVAAIQENVKARVDGMLNSVKLGILLALGTDNVLSRSVATVTAAIDSIRTTMQGAGGLDAAGQFATAVDTVVVAMSAVGSIKFDLVTTAAGAIASLVGALSGLAAKGIAKVDASQVAAAITGMLDAQAAMVAALTNEETMAKLGTAAGEVASALITKFGEIVGQPAFGEDVGAAVGKATVAIAEGAYALAEGFANELGKPELWNNFSAQMQAFVTGFIEGFFKAIGDALYERSIFNPEVRQDALSKMSWDPRTWIEPWIGGMLEGSLLNWDANMAGVTDGLGRLEASSTTAAEALDVLQPGDTWKLAIPGVTTGMGGTPTLDVTANVITIAPPIGDPPEVSVIGKVSRVEMDSAADFSTSLAGLNQMSASGGLQSAGSKLAEAASQLTGWSFAWPKLPEWTWPSLPIFTWPSLPSWRWPNIPSPSWLGRLAVPRPEWLGELLSWSPVVRLQTGGIGGTVPLNAIGTASWSGGLTWVGERGPELVSVPAGSRIYNAHEARNLGDGGGVQVTVNVARMDSQLDEEALAYRIAKKIQRRA